MRPTTGKTGIVDYGMGNLGSLFRALGECGARPVLVDHPSHIEGLDRVLLPGVGAFPEAMKRLRQKRLDVALAHAVLVKQRPFLGICLGMQLLATKGWEVEETSGLGWVEGEVAKLQSNGTTVRLPHVGWNEVFYERDDQIFKNIPQSTDFYFVHSYQLSPSDERRGLAFTRHGGRFVSAVQKDWIFGVQFHPEKSQRAGFRLLANFLSI